MKALLLPRHLQEAWPLAEPSEGIAESKTINPIFMANIIATGCWVEEPDE